MVVQGKGMEEQAGMAAASIMADSDESVEAASASNLSKKMTASRCEMCL